MDSKLRCPSCAEEIQYAAIRCRFCEQEITEAHRRGLPGFYQAIVRNGFTPSSILADYERVCSPYGGNFSGQPMTAIVSGAHTERQLIEAISSRLIERCEDLRQREEGSRSSYVYWAPSEIESFFHRTMNEEFRSIYLSSRYMTRCIFLTIAEANGDRNLIIDACQVALKELRGLSDLARSVDPPMVEYQEMFEHDIVALNNRIRNIGPQSTESTPEILPANGGPRQLSKAVWVSLVGFGILALFALLS